MQLPNLTLLRHRPEFLAVAASGHYCAVPGLVLQVRARPSDAPDLHCIGVGFTATRKIGGAVIRNRAKRRLRALATSVMGENALPAHDYVLVARMNTTIERSFEDLRSDLEKALRRLRCWREAQKIS